MNYIKAIGLKEGRGSGCYPFNIPAVRFLREVGSLPLEKPVTFFVGENGTGKSTLIEAIAVAMGFNGEGGSRDFFFTTQRTHSELHEYLALTRSLRPNDGFFLRAESFYNTASYLAQNSTMKRYGGVSLHEQSHGESFLALALNRFEGNGLYILDEPEAALSPQRLMSLLVIIDGLVKNNSQFIIATHSPILMAYPNADILEFSDDGIRKVGYRETEHYRITKQFIDTPERMIKYLLDE
ncbi:MAG: ABC transporter ATP-binding protein [Ruminococcaceae bacterium]|nr:ABC transporter ATP-binding protein [Oscillospiraceae bacterium]